MCIRFHFCQFYSSYPLNETVDKNKRTVRRVLNAFPKEERNVIESHEPLIFFDDRIMPYLGLTIERDFVEYDNFLSNYQKEIARIADFSRFACIVWISMEIAEDLDMEYKAITIAHEFQHVLQWLQHERLMIEDFLVRKYLRIIGAYSNSEKRNFPIEVDADRKAVGIGKTIFGNDFIGQKIVELDAELLSSKDPRLAERKQEWGHYGTIDLMRPFILVDESALRWKKWETEVNYMGDTIENKPGDRKAEEIEFQKTYVYYKNYIGSR